VHEWSVSQVIEWLSSVDGGRFSQVVVPKGTEGKEYALTLTPLNPTLDPHPNPKGAALTLSLTPNPTPTP
jgi:hypothetical protein